MERIQKIKFQFIVLQKFAGFLHKSEKFGIRFHTFPGLEKYLKHKIVFGKMFISTLLFSTRQSSEILNVQEPWVWQILNVGSLQKYYALADYY